MSVDLARRLALVADDLDHRGYMAAGVVRQGARELSRHRVPTDDACPTCGDPVLQTGRGRPRVYCDKECRRRAENLRRNGQVSA